MSGLSGVHGKPGSSSRNPRLSLAEPSAIIHQDEQAASDPPFSPKQPLSPATVVHLKQTFSKAAQRARNNSAGLADWEGVRKSHVQLPSGAPGVATNSSDNGQRTGASPRPNSLLSPPLVDEPTSYLPPNGLTKPNGHEDNQPESSSEDSHSGDEYTRFKQARKVQSLWRIPSLTAQQRGILKCTIAYTIATLFTFVPILSGLLSAPFDLAGPVRGGHVVATVATYYNPAKTLGAMFEAVRHNRSGCIDGTR
jgi:hypothetical protein